MAKDTSAYEREQYNKKILAEEQHLEDYKSEEKNLLVAIDKYQETMTKSFSDLGELNQELVVQGSRPACLDMDANQEMARFVKSMTNEQKESASKAYSKVQQETSDEIEKLQHQRNNLPWEEAKE